MAQIEKSTQLKSSTEGQLTWMYASSTGTRKSSHGQVNFINKTSVAEKRLNKALAPENLRFESDLNPWP